MVTGGTTRKTALRSVIKARGTRVKEQQQQGQLQRLDVPRQAVQSPGNVAVEQIHLCLIHLWAVPASRGAPHLKQPGCAERVERIFLVSVGLTQADSAAQHRLLQPRR